MLVLCAAIASSPPAAAADADTLHKVRTNGVLRCGIRDDLPGFAFKDSAGRYEGLNVEFCRAVAAAALNDVQKVRLVPVSAAARFPLLLSGAIDVLAHTPTWNLTREAGIGVQYAGIYFYDGQGFLVPKNRGAKSVSDLNGATICTEKGTTHEVNLADVFGVRNLRYVPRVVETLSGAWAAFQAGECGALSADRAALAGLVSQAPERANTFEILPELISEELLGPVVRRGDEQWELLVRWVLFALIRAEELGVGRANVRALSAAPTTQTLARFLKTKESLAKAIGVRADWTVSVIEGVGNYGEIYDRSFGEQSRIRLDRGMNRLSLDGGLLNAPSFD